MYPQPGAQQIPPVDQQKFNTGKILLFVLMGLDVLGRVISFIQDPTNVALIIMAPVFCILLYQGYKWMRWLNVVFCGLGSLGFVALLVENNLTTADTLVSIFGVVIPLVILLLPQVGYYFKVKTDERRMKKGRMVPFNPGAPNGYPPQGGVPPMQSGGGYPPQNNPYGAPPPNPYGAPNNFDPMTGQPVGASQDPMATQPAPYGNLFQPMEQPPIEPNVQTAPPPPTFDNPAGYDPATGEPVGAPPSSATTQPTPYGNQFQTMEQPSIEPNVQTAPPTFDNPAGYDPATGEPVAASTEPSVQESLTELPPQ